MDWSIARLVAEAGCGPISQVARRAQAAEDCVSEEALDARMAQYLLVMRQSVEEGMRRDIRSLSGMSGGQAALLRDTSLAGGAIGGEFIGMAAARAMAVAECNACMGKIVAAPTAGSCGILPAALLTCQEARGLSDGQLIAALFTAAAIGRVIANRASISGAEGGCQAECGSAAAMAAAAMVELMGGTAAMAASACAFALMASLGLVCDPVCGLVEIPCIYRNAAGVTGAITAANTALAGIACPIPADEMIDAMKAVGDQLPASLKETGEGGCAACSSMRGKWKPERH